MAEKKTTKKSTPKVAKDAKKTQNVKETKTEVVCNCGENKEVLNRIYYCLIIIIVITALILVTLIVKGTNNNSTSSSSNNGGSTTETTSDDSSGEYDVSMFDTLTTTDALSQINDGKKHLVYIGRSTCHFCVQFLPVLQKAQEEYGYKTIYVNLEEITNDDQSKWNEFGGVLRTYDESCEESEDASVEEKCGEFGATPMVLIFENGKLKDSWVGYTEYDDFASFLEDNGYSK